MEFNLCQRLEEVLVTAIHDVFGIDVQNVIAKRPSSNELGDAAFAIAFDLARKARMSPLKIAESLAPHLSTVLGVDRVEIAGGGYLNVFFDRPSFIQNYFTKTQKNIVSEEKIIIEHTNINPNKAAHIGHLRNAALGDSFVRLLRYQGTNVEVQNYIDDTGVQVADVVVGFLHLKKKSLSEVQSLANGSRFDYVCWDLYARVSEFYNENRERLKLRENTLKAIEENSKPEAPLGRLISETIVRCHLATMERIDVHYDLLPWESDILKLQFWERAYELLKAKHAIRLSSSGKNNGCWVMDINRSSTSIPTEEDEKVIVRSNGTVTYVGKDIAYQLWKLGLLDRQFGFKPFKQYSSGQVVWSTTDEGSVDTPNFGQGSRVYNVIDVRQAYLQDIVQQGVAMLSSKEARDRSHHFSYEMVALTPETCRQLGFTVHPEEKNKPYLEVSGRKGLGVKADDLLNELEDKAYNEVKTRNPKAGQSENRKTANAIARGALRYFMIKYTKNKVIAFDFNEALSFEGDSGPYLQYAAVRAKKILQKVGAKTEICIPIKLRQHFESLDSEEADDLWALISQATDLDTAVDTAIRTQEPAHLARFALLLAQRFNGFYHKYHVSTESNEIKRTVRTIAVQIFLSQHTTALKLIGIPTPTQM